MIILLVVGIPGTCNTSTYTYLYPIVFQFTYMYAQVVSHSLTNM